LRENRVRTSWQNGTVVINGWLHIPSSWSAEVMAHQGWDSLTIDMQHGLMDYQTALTMLQAISTTPVTPFVRVSWNEPGLIGRMLDAGAYGIICPMINTRADAEAFVAACRFAPQGQRSLGPTRANLYAGPDYAVHANKTLIAMAMIETAQALENVESIVSVPGLDGVYIGPGDLSLSLLGRGQVDSETPEMLAAIERIYEATSRQGIAAGIHTNSPEYANRWIAKGFRFVTVMTDTRLLSSAASAAVKAVKGKTPEPSQSGTY
jgi:4-hydroxy-2-oxoheptanedioate aldolase